MAQEPLSPADVGKGESPLWGARISRAEFAEYGRRLDELGLSKSEFTRRCLRYGMRHLDDVLAVDESEVSTKAS